MASVTSFGACLALLWQGPGAGWIRWCEFLYKKMQETNQSSEKKRDLTRKAWICAISDQKLWMKRFI